MGIENSNTQFEVAKTAVTKGSNVEPTVSEAVIEKVSTGMAAKIDEDLEKAVGKGITITAGQNQDDLNYQLHQNVEEKADGIYTPNEDAMLPDFDVELIMKEIEDALYVELPVWKKKLEQFRKNMEDVKFYMHLLPSYQKIMEKKQNDPNYEPSTSEELQFYNELQRSGVSMEMQLKSFDEKYEINMKFVDEAIKRIDERYENEAGSMKSLPTSKKNEMLASMVRKNLEAVSAEENPNKKLVDYLTSMGKVYNNRTSFHWIEDKIKSGTTPRSVANLYKNWIKSHTVMEMVNNTFGFEFCPIINTVSSEVMEFFMYYVCFISAISDKKKAIDIRARIIKEYATCMIQNLGDIGDNLFDLRDVVDSNPAYEIIPAPTSEEENEEYEAQKRAAAEVYVSKLAAIAIDMYKQAFNK